MVFVSHGMSLLSFPGLPASSFDHLQNEVIRPGNKACVGHPLPSRILQVTLMSLGLVSTQVVLISNTIHTRLVINVAVLPESLNSHYGCIVDIAGVVRNN